MDVRQLLSEKRSEILRLATAHGVRSIRVFGSAARGEADEASDVDFLVEMDENRSVLDMGRLLMDLQDILGRNVDLVEPEGLHWSIRDRILQEAVPL